MTVILSKAFQGIRHRLRRIAAVGVVAAIVIGGGSVALAQTPSHGFVNRVSIDHERGNEHRYVVFVPAGVPPEEGWPVVLFLHGAGERGTDGRKQITVGLGPALKRRGETFPAVVVFPQADYAEGPILETWRPQEPGGKLAMSILAEVERDYPIDPQRRTITGWSMGAYGALSLGAAYDGHWAKVLAICGGGDPEWAPSLAQEPVWIIHGGRDTVVPISEAREMAAAFEGLDHQMTFTEVAEAEHDLCTGVYQSDAVLDWMVSSEPTPPTDAALSASAASPQASAATDEETPFIPALVISRAISLRLGNAALQTLVEGLPEKLGKTGLSGTLETIEDQVEFDDRSFDVRFSELTYQGRLHRAILSGRATARMQLSFAVRDFQVNIGRVEVSDSRDRVIAGPVSVIIGHREPVWLDFQVQPRPSPSGGLSLHLLESEFTIPDHNWYVKPPTKIEIQGELFTEEIVKTALVGGVYLRKVTIEQNILAAVPEMLAEVERQVDFSPLSYLITALWPLPVYSPRVQVRLEETSTDSDGISLVFGCVVANIDPNASTPSDVPQVIASAPPAVEMPRAPDLQAGVSLEVIGHLSALVSGSDAVRLYAADVPGRPFQELDDVAAVMAAAGTAGSESSVQDLRSQFLLSEPFSLRPLPTRSAAPAERHRQSIDIAIDVPRLSMKVFQKTIEDASGSLQENSRSEAWSLLAERELTIRQPLRLTAESEIDGPTTLQIQWSSNSDIADSDIHERTSGTDSSPPATPVAPPRLTGLFEQGWQRWAASQGNTELSVPDIAVGPAMLRLDGLFWEGNRLTAAFQPAPTILVNNTDRPVQYRIRGPHSRWSSEYTIEPHRRHVYRTGYSLHARLAESSAPEGQPLSLGTYDWSPSADSSGFHWVRRDPLDAAHAPEAQATSGLRR